MTHTRAHWLSWSITFTAACISLSLLGLPTSASRAADPVRRHSNDRDRDLIDAMIRDGMFDAASKICAAELAIADRRSDEFAKWTIRQSSILVQRQLSNDDFSDANILAVCQPINDLLRQYPDHRRALFLRTAILEADAAAARHDVVIAAVLPFGGEREQRALRRFATLSREASELIAEIDSARSAEESHGETSRSKTASDLNRLQQEIMVLRVSMQLLQTEMFAPGSRDYVATATNAVAAADEAIARLPADCLARREMERIRVQAILRTGDHRRARSELDSLERLDANTPIVLALEIQIDLAGGQYDLAKNRLNQFFGTSPMEAPASVEMDLARLAYLIAVGSSEVGSWLDAIDGRGGAYARRRAESVSLDRLRSGKSTSAVNPSLVAAQAQDWLRRGEPQRAAELLSVAAVAELDHDQALHYARDAAAALVSINHHRDAGDLLAKLSVEKRDAQTAAEMQLQAAFLFVSSAPTNGSTRESTLEVAQSVEASLRNTINLWPDSVAADNAKAWLVKILRSQQRLVEAAETAMPSSTKETTQAARRDRLNLWTSAMQSATSESRPEVGRRLVRSFEPLLNETDYREEFRHAAILLLDRDQLASVPDAGPDTSDRHEVFLEALLRFRGSGNASPALAQPPEDLVQEAGWRLMEDARQNPRLRRVTARLVDQWKMDDIDSLDHALRLVWLGETSASVAMLRRLIDRSESRGVQLRRAAELLASTDDAKARGVAVTLWDELASGLPKGERSWHDAKLSAIELLNDIGQKGEAIRRAKYILLTSPPTDDAMKRRYERYTQ